MRASPPAGDLIGLLGDPANRRILGELSRGPTHPRALAASLGMTEGNAQRKLHRLRDAGLVEGTWVHTDRTVKEYRLVATGLTIGIREGRVDVTLVA